ncbi:MAG TPA: hypothetical protein VFK70_07860 [Vicinamibacteria bacterium]|nr:hypothetical protein [Vicinamibacteria bacterium]
MGHWSRHHQDGRDSILAKVERLDGRPHVTVVGTGHEVPPVEMTAGTTDDDAKGQADAIVADEFDHMACAAGCQGWELVDED